LNFERIKSFPQYLIPQHAVSLLMGNLADRPLGKITTSIINWFAKKYHVNMQEAIHEDTAYFSTFNAFFTREIKPETRPLAQEYAIIQPADGIVSQLGKIESDQMIQAKGHFFSCMDIVGGQQNLAAKFNDGHFANIYLSPKDYHRVHMPIRGKLLEMHHIPGKLFSVNPFTARTVPNLFARNERVLCLFETELGLMAQILVGATIVGSIETVWHGTVTPPSSSEISSFYYEGDNAITLEQGQEMGRFKLGSTVILMFEPNKVSFLAQLQSESAVKMGEGLGQAQKRQ